MKTTAPAPAFCCLVRLAVPGLGPLSYAPPPGTRSDTIARGSVALAPLRGRPVPGVVTDPAAPLPDGVKLKSLIRISDLPPLRPEFVAFLEKTAAYYCADFSAALEAALPNAEELRPRTRRRIYYRSASAAAGKTDSEPEESEETAKEREDLLDMLFPIRRTQQASVQAKEPKKRRAVTARMTPKRAVILEALKDGEARPKEELDADVPALTAMVKAGMLRAEAREEITEEAHEPLPRPRPNLPPLSPEQEHAAAELLAAPGAPGFKITLLRGMTGSGKTEVFFRAMAETLERDPEAQCLLLVPEIALASQMQERAKERFGTEPVLWHSALTPARRRRNRRAICTGEAKIVLGARSALFLPYPNLKLAVVDEEHETSYKQEESFRYHARDALAVRAANERFALVLASATPSLETAKLAREGKYSSVRLSARHGAAKPPAFHILDMRRTPPAPGEWISEPLAAALRACFAEGKQALLFLNRRGYAPVVMCKRCGFAHECGECAARMTYHRAGHKLACHSCGRERPMPPVCPSCASEDPPGLSGPGVERLLEEARRRFPEANALALSADDSAAGTMAEAIARVQSGEIKLLIGTQIVAKGLHFPNLTVSGIIDADAGLRGCDPRASERAFQLIRQAAGRAGRGESPGSVYLQTYQPQSPFFALLRSADQEAFEREELLNRQDCANPPYTRFIVLMFASENEISLQRASAEAALRLSETLPEGVTMLGPAPPPMGKKRGKFLMRIILRSADLKALRAALRSGLERITPPADTDFHVDVDPLSL